MVHNFVAILGVCIIFVLKKVLYFIMNNDNTHLPAS